MPQRKSPRDAQCPHCKKWFTRMGLLEHKRHVRCSPTSKATPRKWERARCKYCLKSFHSVNSLRTHVSGQHPDEYRRSPNSVKAHRAPLKKSPKESRGRDGRQPSPGGQGKQSPGTDKRSPGSTAPPKPKGGLVEDLVGRSQDPATSRRVWEEVLRRQQVQKDKSQSVRK